MVTGVSPLGLMSGLVFDDKEQGFSFSMNTTRRQLRVRIGDSFPRTSPRMGEVIPGGRTGWCKLSLVSDGGIVAAMIVTHPKWFSSSGTHTGGRNLHRVTLSDTARIVVPVFPASC